MSKEYQIEKEWITEAGFKAAILKLNDSVFRIGHRCGYVGIPSTHEDHNKSYEDIDVCAHGGLTYSGDSRSYPTISTEEENLWWVGFDCAHIDDIESIGGQTLEYCIKECESIANQLKEGKSNYEL